MSAPEIRAAEAAAADSGARGPLFYVGATALLLAMAVDALAVLGRHIGLPLLGSLELVQAAIVVASSTAIVFATLANRHAAARFLLDRSTPRVRLWLQQFARVLTLLFFLILASGQTWIAHDLWDGHEDSELLHIPFAPLRLVSILAVLMAAAITLRRLLRRSKA
jgi:TRAP-type C4-dicarboxylate transport system permease small subunit